MKRTVLIITSTLISFALFGCTKMQNFGKLGEYATAMYPGAVITEIDREDNGYFEVEFLHNRKRKEMTFDTNSKWVSTKWDVNRSELPDAVINQLQKSHAGWRIDDAEYVETPAARWYDIELEKAGIDIHALDFRREIFQLQSRVFG